MALSFKNPLLRDRDGRRLVVAQFADHFAIGIANVALPWLVLSGGGGVALTGLVFTMGTLPYLFFGLAAGVTGDRRSRKRVMLAAFPLQALVAFLIPLGTASSGRRPRARARVRLRGGRGRVYVDAASLAQLPTSSAARASSRGRRPSRSPGRPARSRGLRARRRAHRGVRARRSDRRPGHLLSPER